MGAKVKYTRAELLALSPKPHEYSISAGTLKKFNLIEDKSAEKSDETESLHTGSGAGAGRKTSGKNAPLSSGRGTSGVSNHNSSNNERFVPPPRGWRGTRDQEAFEEGYKYELERNALQKQELQETMAKEQQRSDIAAREIERKLTAASAANEERKSSEDDMERLLTSIAATDETNTRKVVRSRFFSGTDADASGGGGGQSSGVSAPSFPVDGPVPSVTDQWSSLNVHSATSAVVWGDGDQELGHVPSPAVPVPSPLPVAADGPAGRAWTARELEQLLMSGQRPEAAPKPGTPTRKPAEGKPIEAAQLESQLLQQVQQSSARPEPPRPPVAPSAPSTAQRLPPPPPPPVSQAQAVPMSMAWNMPVGKAPSPMVQQLLMQQPPMPQVAPTRQPPRHPAPMRQPVPIIMSSDGHSAPFYAHAQAMPAPYVTGLMFNQGQQPMMVYRAADGTTPYAMGTPSYPPGMHFAQQQPQQR